MNCDELAKVIHDAVEAEAALAGYDEYCSMYVARIAADAAIAALAPKLTWTEWEHRTHSEQVSFLMVGQIKVATMAKDQFRLHGAIGDGPILVAPGNTDEAIATLRAKIERRVREAMEGKP